MSNLYMDSWKETRYEEIQEELYHDITIVPFIEKKAYEQLLHEIANGIGFY